MNSARKHIKIALLLILTAALLSTGGFLVSSKRYRGTQSTPPLRNNATLPPQKLDEFSPYIEANKIGELIVRESLAGNPIEVFLVLDDGDIRSEIDRMKSDLGVGDDTPVILAKRAALLTERKASVLRLLDKNDYEVLRIYDTLSLVFIKIKHSQALRLLLHDPLVLYIRKSELRSPSD